MNIPVSQLKGITEQITAALAAEGIARSDQLLAASVTRKDRKALAARVGIEARVVLELANRADLSRVSGVAGVYSDLLEKAGVDTVAELATRNPANLHSRISELNAGEQYTSRVPTLDMVSDWVGQAKGLGKILTY